VHPYCGRDAREPRGTGRTDPTITNHHRRRDTTMKRILWTTGLAALLLPAIATAQQRSENPWQLDVHAGAFRDAHDISADGRRTAVQGGVRVGYRLTERARATAGVSLAWGRDVADSRAVPDHYVYDNEWVLTTAGAEYDLLPGRTALAFGIEAGAAWRQIHEVGRVGAPAGVPEYAGHGYSATAVLVPSLTLRREVTDRLALTAGAADHLMLGGPTKHSLAARLGVSLR
jgi:hypothetical protein